MLRLQAEPGAKPIHLAALSTDGAVQEIACVELDAGLGGKHLEHAPADRFFHARREPERAPARVQHPIVVVSFSQLQLLVSLLDSRPNWSGLAEIEGCSRYSAKFSERNQARIHGSVAIRLQGDQVSGDVA